LRLSFRQFSNLDPRAPESGDMLSDMLKSGAFIVCLLYFGAISAGLNIASIVDQLV
jgi:hypothetical protein